MRELPEKCRESRLPRLKTTKTRCFGLHFCRWKFRYIFNHFHAMRPGIYRVLRNNAKWGPFHRSRSFKVIDFGTNRKLIYDFLLVINTNLIFILHRFRHMAFKSSKITIFGFPSCVYPPPRRGSPGTIFVQFSWMSTDGQGTKRRKTLPTISTRWVGRTKVTDDRRTTDNRRKVGP